MSLHIHHAAHLVPLADHLATVLAEPLPDPFAAELVGVPTAGVRDWLQRHLARHLGATAVDDGICANIQMVFPQRFNAAALGRDLDQASPWDLSVLTWSALDAVHEGSVTVPGARARHHHGDDGGRYTRARRLADLFDRYATHRPSMLQQWRAGRFGDGTVDDNGAVVPLPPDQTWQAELWSALRSSIAVPTTAERLPVLLEDLRAGRINPQVPRRVAMFGISAVSAVQLDVLRALAAVREVHLYVVHPSPVAWQRCRQHLNGGLVLRASADATAAVLHPLLRSWARPPMETAALLGGVDAVVTCVDRSRRRRSMLADIQREIIADQVPDAIGRAGRADRSIQVHACHGTTRQLEVLRDALAHLFAVDPTLQPHDVLVLTPDLARFAPLIASVFARSSLPVPVRVSDESLGTDNPVAAALSTVLTTVAGRCSGPDVLELIATEPVRRTFGFQPGDAERVAHWVAALGTTWGLDSSHRGQWVPEHIVDGTWAATLDRLLVGAAMPAPSPRVGAGDIVPFDDMDAHGVEVAGRLAELVRRLRDARERCSATRTITAWADVLRHLVEQFATTADDDAWQSAELLAALADLGAVGRASSVPLSLSDARAVLTSVLSDQRGRLHLRSGSVTVTPMVPIRNVPARVVCVLGLDDVSVRASGFDGDDILGSRQCVGERDPRVEGRQALLDALMSADEHFLVTCDGHDLTTNRPLPLPVVLGELLDVVSVDGADSPVVTRHPRQAFDERNFTTVAPDDVHATPRRGAGGPERACAGSPFSFDAAMLHAADVRRRAVSPLATWPLLPAAVAATVTCAELADGCSRPSRTLLAGRLDVRLPREVEDLDTSIPIRFTGLDQWQLGRELLDLHQSATDDDRLFTWREAHRRSGALPPRLLADAVLDDAAREVDALLGARPELRDLFVAATEAAEVDVELSAGDLHQRPVRLVDTIQRIHDHQLVRVAFTRPSNRASIGAAIELATLVLTRPSGAWTALIVTRPKSGSRKPIVEHLRPQQGAAGTAAALHLLEVALALHLRALREPIPLFEKSSSTLHRTGTIDDDELERDNRRPDVEFLWGGFTADDILAMPVRSDDELAGVARDGRGRARGYADLLWNAYEAFVGGAVDGEADG